MPTDKLEDFILNNRESFDDETPPTDLWGRIAGALGSGDDDNDPLEGFVATNREAFDDVTPPPRLEGRIFAAMGEAGATPMAPARETTLPRLKAVRGRRRAPTEEIRANLLEVPVSQRAALVDQLIETYRTKLSILLRIQEHLPSKGTPSSTTQQQNNEL